MKMLRVRPSDDTLALRKIHKQLRIAGAWALSISFLAVLGFTIQNVYFHPTYLTITEALGIISVDGGDEDVRHQAHFVLDKISKQSSAGLARDASKTGALGKGCMIRMTRRATDIISNLKGLQSDGGSVGEAAKLALQQIAKETDN